MRILSHALAGLALAVSCSAWASEVPGSRCDDIRGAAEQRICSTPELATSAHALQQTYQQAIARLPDEAKVIVEASQERWADYLASLCVPENAPRAGGYDYMEYCLRRLIWDRQTFLTNKLLETYPGNVVIVKDIVFEAEKAAEDREDQQPAMMRYEGEFPVFLSPPSLRGPHSAIRLGDFGMGPAWAEDSGYAVEHADDAYLTIGFYSYAFYGGAHGLPQSGFETIDLAKGAVLDKRTIFRADGPWRKRLAELCDAELIRIADAEDWHYNAGPDGLRVEDMNTWLIGSAFGLHFDPYAVSSYGAGSHTVWIPFAALREVLTPEFAASVGLH